MIYRIIGWNIQKNYLAKGYIYSDDTTSIINRRRDSYYNWTDYLFTLKKEMKILLLIKKLLDRFKRKRPSVWDINLTPEGEFFDGDDSYEIE